jgi:hypothetical protein
MGFPTMYGQEAIVMVPLKLSQSRSIYVSPTYQNGNNNQQQQQQHSNPQN